MKKTLEQIEAERISRRQALSRIGFLAGASAVAALTSDELLRKVGAELQKRAENNKVASAVAKEFQSAGIAFADDIHHAVPHRRTNIDPYCKHTSQAFFCAALDECYLDCRTRENGVGCPYPYCDRQADCLALVNGCIADLVYNCPHFYPHLCEITNECEACA